MKWILRIRPRATTLFRKVPLCSSVDKVKAFVVVVVVVVVVVNV